MELEALKSALEIFRDVIAGATVLVLAWTAKVLLDHEKAFPVVHEKLKNLRRDVEDLKDAVWPREVHHRHEFPRIEDANQDD